jgi:4-hydroxy-tetrahydrodipicolinate reductase
MRYGVVGHSGRMGNEIVRAFHGHELTLTIDAEKEWKDKAPEVIVDFSSPAATSRTIEMCREHESALVIGTTALSSKQLQELMELGHSVPVVQSFNFSTGINILKIILRESGYMLSDWEMVMSETHHSKKKDAPSGTAILLQEASGRECDIASLRMGGVPGDHEVYFANEGEVVKFSHRALSRGVFALGALKAAEFAVTKDQGFYTFEEVIQCAQKK